jgi:hypothetical protein
MAPDIPGVRHSRATVSTDDGRSSAPCQRLTPSSELSHLQPERVIRRQLQTGSNPGSGTSQKAPQSEVFCCLNAGGNVRYTSTEYPFCPRTARAQAVLKGSRGRRPGRRSGCHGRAHYPLEKCRHAASPSGAPNNPKAPEWRLRVGDWRVLLLLDPPRRAIVVTRALPRGRAYRD